MNKFPDQNTQTYPATTTSAPTLYDTGDPPPSPGRGSSRLEAPFQLAIEKQRSLSRQGRPYLRHSWNRVDFVSIVCFWIMFILSITHVEATGSRHIYIFRALSVLRISRLLAVTSGTTVSSRNSLTKFTIKPLRPKTTMRSLKTAAPLLVKVAMLLLFATVLFSYVFALCLNFVLPIHFRIIGVQSFKGSYRRACQISKAVKSCMRYRCS